MSEEEKTVNTAGAVPKGSLEAVDEQEILTGQAKFLKPAASARGEGTGCNTLDRFALKFAAACRCNRPFGSLRFTQTSPAGETLALVASNNPNQVILNNEPQNQALCNWCDVTVRICDCNIQDCRASLCVSDIPGTENIQTALLATRNDRLVYCFNGTLCGNLNVLNCMSCMDSAQGSQGPCNDPCQDPCNDPCEDSCNDPCEDPCQNPGTCP